VAPPIVAVRMHYIGPYPDKAAFVTAVANWVEKQDASKTLMPGAIRRFNIMPPVAVSREDAEKIIELMLLHMKPLSNEDGNKAILSVPVKCSRLNWIKSLVKKGADVKDIKIAIISRLQLQTGPWILSNIS